MDGMWTGIPPRSSSFNGGGGGGENDQSSSSLSHVFVCPQQPSLHLPPSRINDGICDCCDGADEKPQQQTSTSSSTYSSSCPDICNVVLAAERAAHEKLQQDYTIGSQLRTLSIHKFQKWKEGLQTQIQKVSSQDIVNVEQRVQVAEQVLSKQQIDLVKMWTVAVEEVLGQSSLDEIVKGMGNVQKLGLFIISLCQLSGEASVDQVVNGRCLAFDRASLDMGILWDDNDVENLPSFHVFDADNEESIASYAEKLVLRLEGKDERSDSSTKAAAAKSSSSSNNDRRVKKRSEPEPEVIDDDDDEDHDFHYDDDYIGHSGDSINEQDDIAVRDSFKEHGNAILAASSVTDDDEADTDGGGGRGSRRFSNRRYSTRQY